MLRHTMKDKSIDGWNLASLRPFRRYNTEEYAISSNSDLVDVGG